MIMMKQDCRRLMIASYNFKAYSFTVTQGGVKVPTAVGTLLCKVQRFDAIK